MLVAGGAILQSVESLFPSPLPGVRLGLANIMTVVALADLGPAACIEVATLRTVISSFMLGTFLSPTFILSFSAALTSSVAMALAFQLTTLSRKPILSLIGISLVGATVHNMTQIGLVYLLLVRHAGVFLLLPWLGISAVVMGWITGLVAARACQALQIGGAPMFGVKPAPPTPRTPLPSGSFEPRRSLIHRLPASLKIAGVVVTAVVVLCLERFGSFALVLLFLCALAVAAHVCSWRWLTPIRKLWLFILFSFAVPVAFTRTGAIWCQLGPLIITADGAAAGARVAWRIVLLMLSTSLLVRTTAPEDLAEGLHTLLGPLRLLGLRADRMATTLSLAWTSIPVLWERAQDSLVRRRRAARRWRDVIPDFGAAIGLMYVQAGEAAGSDLGAGSQGAASPLPREAEQPASCRESRSVPP